MLGRFLRSDYWWIVYTAIGVFVVLLGTLLVSQPRESGLDRRRSLIQAIILSLPLFYLPLAVSSELSIEAAEKRSLFTPRIVVKRSESPKPMVNESELSMDAAEKKDSPTNPNVAPNSSEQPKPTQSRPNPKAQLSKPGSATTAIKSNEPNLWNLISDPKAFEGSNATVIGRVYKGKRLSSDSFFCYRLLMVCCAADASPAGVIVKWPDTSKLKKGAWVKVHGKVGFTMFEGEKWATIIATKVDRISPPKNKFLIPG